MQKLIDDLVAPWFLALWTIAPTPAKARRLRKPTVERLLSEHRMLSIGTQKGTPVLPHDRMLPATSRRRSS